MKHTELIEYPPGYFSEPVRDWWSDFQSECCDPASPHCVLRKPTQVAAARILKASGKARKEGKGWADGTISHMRSSE